MKKTFEEAQAQAELLYKKVSDTSEALNGFIDKFPRGPMNLTPDNVKAMPEYKALHKAYGVAFESLREYNKDYTKTFAKELRDQRNAKRAAIMLENMGTVDSSLRP